MNWRLMPLDDTHAWLKRMAGMMRLEEDRCLPGKTIIFTRGKAIKDGNIDHGAIASDDFIKALPRSGWKHYPSRLINIWRHDAAPHVICDIRQEEQKDSEIIKMSLALFPLYQDVIKAGGLPIHAGLVNNKGKGLAFAARGGTGKTTTCRRLSSVWPEVCDDLFIALPGSDGEFYAYPFPTWSEHAWHSSTRTWDVSEPLPLEAIFYINHSDKNYVRPLQPEEATLFIYYSAIQVCDVLLSTLSPDVAKQTRIRMRDNACNIVSKVHAYYLYASLEGDLHGPIDRALDGR